MFLPWLILPDLLLIVCRGWLVIFKQNFLNKFSIFDLACAIPIVVLENFLHNLE